MDKLQTNYILFSGLKMLGLAFLAMAAAVMVTFLSSQVAATLGRNLRNSVYRKVISFSGEELNHFSIASLITRSTNDVQQVQMLFTMLFRIVLYAPILGIGGVYKVFQTDASMTWILALAVVVITLFVFLVFKLVMPKFTKLQYLIDELNLVAREILTGVPVIRAFSREKHEMCIRDRLLDGLKERGVQVTFFLIGQNIEGKEDVVKRMKAEGHLIGNHTYHHVNLKEISEKKAEEEVQMTCNKIYDTAGICTSFVRPPFGEWKKNLDFDITMIPVSWNVDSLDWTTENVDKTVKRVVKDVEEGDIILMHDIYASSVEAALRIVDILQEKGYEFVTVDELLLE